MLVVLSVKRKSLNKIPKHENNNNFIEITAAVICSDFEFSVFVDRIIY